MASLRERVAAHKLSAEARITTVLASATRADANDDDEPGAAGAWNGRGVYRRPVWSNGPPPQTWQLADWVASLQADGMVATAIADRVHTQRKAGAAGAGAAALPDPGDEDVREEDVLGLSSHDVKMIGETTASMLVSALEERLQLLRAHASDVAAAAAAPQGAGHWQPAPAPAAHDDPLLEASVGRFTLDLQRFDHVGGAGAAAEGKGSGAGVDFPEDLEVQWLEEVGMPVCEQQAVLRSMQDEHLSAADSTRPFQPVPGAASTTPQAEWWIVAGSAAVNPDGTYSSAAQPVDPAAAAAPHDARTADADHFRVVRSVHDYQKMPEAVAAGLAAPELVALRLWTGPMATVR